MTESEAIHSRIEAHAEWLKTVRVSQDGWAKVVERNATDAADIASALKQGKIIAHIPQHLRVSALDAACDREVTANGCAYLLGFDKDSADKAVLDSNDSKLNADGTAVILPGGKIGKSERYKAPELKGFV